MARPTKQTPEIVAKLLAAYNNAYNDEEAADYAGIDRATLWRWKQEDEQLCNKIDEAKRLPNRKAKENVITAINEGDPSTSKWWLERKDPDFKNKAAVELDPNEEKIEAIIKGLTDDPANKPNVSDDSTADTAKTTE